MASTLLDSKHNLTEVQEVLDKLRRDDKAFFDEKRMVRKVPIFVYDPDGKPQRISYWQERQVTASWEEAQLRHLDYYHARRGWIREGKKAERDYDYQPDPLED